jgi:hypothetical protein
MKVLFSRYPDLLKYMMSCSPETGSASRWCGTCPMCAKSYLYTRAVAGDPAAIGFATDMFQAEKRELYPLFAKNITRPYERPAAVRDEQLLAFLLAERNGATGELVEEFTKRYRDEATGREGELRKKFFGIHDAPNLPESFSGDVLKILTEELAEMQT